MLTNAIFARLFICYLSLVDWSWFPSKHTVELKSGGADLEWVDIDVKCEVLEIQEIYRNPVRPRPCQSSAFFPGRRVAVFFPGKALSKLANQEAILSCNSGWRQKLSPSQCRTIARFDGGTVLISGSAVNSGSQKL